MKTLCEHLTQTLLNLAEQSMILLYNVSMTLIQELLYGDLPDV